MYIVVDAVSCYMTSYTGQNQVKSFGPAHSPKHVVQNMTARWNQNSELPGVMQSN